MTLWLTGAAVVVTGCGSLVDAARGGPQASAEELYRDAKRSLGSGNFVEAVETFETLGALYPFGNFTQQAQLDVAYACLLYTSPSPRDQRGSRMPSSA